jgi:MFS family permease
VNRSRFAVKSPFRGFPPAVAALTTVAFFVAVGFGLVIPAIPIFAASFGVSATAIGFVISAFAVARLLSGLIAGKMVERFGERLVLGSGLMMVSLFTLFTALAQSYSQLLIFRTAGGLGSSMFSVAAGSLLLRSVGDEQRGRAQSLFNGGFLLGAITGPAFGGILMGISLRAPFFIYTVTLLIAATFALVRLTSTRLGDKSAKPSINGRAMRIREAMAIPAYRIALALTFIGSWVLFGLRSSLVPLYVTEELGASATVVGLGFTFAALANGTILLRAGRITDFKGRRHALLIGSYLVFAGLIILTFATSPELYLLSMIVMGFGGAFFGSAPGALVGDAVKGRGGRVIAFFQMAGDAGMMIGPILLGIVTDLGSYQLAFGFTVLLFLLTFPLVLSLPKNDAPAKSENLLPPRED